MVPQAGLSKEEWSPGRVMSALPQGVRTEVRSPHREVVSPPCPTPDGQAKTPGERERSDPPANPVSSASSDLEHDHFSPPPLLPPWVQAPPPQSLAGTTAGSPRLNKVSHFMSLLCSNPPLTPVPLGAEPTPTRPMGLARAASLHPSLHLCVSVSTAHSVSLCFTVLSAQECSIAPLDSAWPLPTGMCSG